MATQLLRRKEFEAGVLNIVNEIPVHNVFVELFTGNITDMYHLEYSALNISIKK